MSRYITKPDDTSFTPLVSAVPSNASAGDLVYYNKDGSYGRPPVSSLTGSPAYTVANNPSPYSDGISGGYTTALPIYGGSNGKSFTILTSGNYAVVYIDRNLGQPFFYVTSDPTTQSGVVAPTSISSVFVDTVNSNIGVTALPNGTFVVYWRNSAGGTADRINYAIYTDAGAVVRAATQDTVAGVAVGATNIEVCADPSSNFVICFANGSTVYFRGFNSGGTALYAWVTSFAANAAATYGFGVACRSDGTFLIAAPSSTSNLVVYGLYTLATGVISGVVNTVASTIGNTTMTAVDVDLLADGTTFIIAYVPTVSVGTVRNVAFRFLPLNNVMGLERIIPAANFTNASATNGANQYGIRVSGPVYLPSIAGYAFSIVCTAQLGFSAQYALFNSSGACLSGTSGTVTASNTAAIMHSVISSYPINGKPRMEVYQPSPFLTTAFCLFLPVSSQAQTVYGMTYSTITSVGNTIASFTTAQSIAATGIAASYSEAGSTPAKASFNPTAGAAPYTTSAAATVLTTPFLVDSSATSGHALSTLANGKFAVAFVRATSGNIQVNIYSALGVYENAILIPEVSNFTSTSANSAIRMCCQGDVIAVAYTTSTTTLKVAAYNVTTLAAIGATVSITTGAMGIGSGGINWDIADITNGKYVIVYPSTTGQRAAFQVYSLTTNTQVVAQTLISAGVVSTMAVAGFSGGGFAFAGHDQTANVGQFYTYANPTGNTFTSVVTATGLGAFGTATDNRYIATMPGGYVLIQDATSADNARAYGTALTGLITGLTYDNSSVGSAVTGRTAVGFTGLSAVVNFSFLTASPFTATFRTATFGNAQPATVTVGSTVVGSSVVALPAISSSFDNNFALLYRDNSARTNFTIISAGALTNFATLAGTELSVGVPIYPGSTVATPAVSHTVLVGVGLGADLVQLNGSISLNANYTTAATTSQSFDFTGQAVPGVRGTLRNSLVTMTGNK